MTAMSSKDFESLAQMLDKNAAFSRPEGQLTGYSLREADGDDSTRVVPVADGAPASLPLPSTVVDKQLHLPVPTHSKAAQQARAAESRVRRPRGHEIWTQEELEALYKAGARAGVAVPTTVPAAVPAANACGGSAKNATLRPSPGAVEPTYSVLYQQKIRAEDVYLGVDFTRDESSAGSDGIVVKVEMPATTSASNVTLTVEPFQLTLSSPDYYLLAPLPQKVLSGVANARWDSEARTLTIRLTADSSQENVKVL